MSTELEYFNPTVLVVGPRGCSKSIIVEAAEKGVYKANSKRTSDSVAHSIIELLSGEKLKLQANK